MIKFQTNIFLKMSSRRELLKYLATGALGTWAIPASAALPNTLAVMDLPDEQDPNFWDHVRDQFLLSRSTTFFNPGTMGVISKPVYDKMVAHLYKTAVDIAEWNYGDDYTWMTGYWPMINLRTKIGQIIGAHPQEIALTENVTSGMSYIAMGLNLKAGDEVLTTDQEHSGGLGAWQVREKRDGIVLRQTPFPKPVKDTAEVLAWVKKNVTPATRVIMLSHMITGSGAILPIKEICQWAQERDIVTVIDGAQAIGHIKVDVHDLGCDAYTGCFHKWMGSPAGCGVMYVRDGLFQELYPVVANGGWNNDDPGYRFTQRGTGSQTQLVGLEAALDFHLALGPERVYERIKYLGDYLRAGLRKIPQARIYSAQDESMNAGITVYNLDGWTGPKLMDIYWEKKRMRPRTSGETFGVRHCTHIFNSERELDEALAFLKTLV